MDGLLTSNLKVLRSSSGARPKTGVFKDQDGDPNVFKDAINPHLYLLPG